MSELVAGPLHADVAPLAFLLGTWRGAGSGGYPTIDPFEYEEELRFEHVGDTFLLYQQRSGSPQDGSPIHLERGFLRPGEPGRVELMLAHPLGLTEIAEGALDSTGLDATALELVSREIGRTTTRMYAIALIRRYRVQGDTLRYETEMQTERTLMTRHLEAELHRVGP